MMWEDVNSIWKDWRVYAVAAAITIAGLVYSCNKRFETGSYMQLSDVPKQEKSDDYEEFDINKKNLQKFSKSRERMTEAGACFNERQRYALMKCVDANEDHVIDDQETDNLCNYWLNPESPFGRIALPYRGQVTAPSGSSSAPPNLRDLLPVFEPYSSYNRLERYVLALTDADGNNFITEDEALRMAYKVRQALNE